ncbi:hypothetical protein HDU84_005330 [Entophlyctis sp. JEL0112]|nr:hypothetical protein HDU84_005330 [Entophlyctis sp. JEL0112]
MEHLALIRMFSICRVRRNEACRRDFAPVTRSSLSIFLFKSPAVPGTLKTEVGKEQQLELSGIVNVGIYHRLMKVLKPADHVWAHAANTVEDLSAAMADVTISAIEADVILSSWGLAVMGHPPATDGELSIDEFLSRIRDRGWHIDGRIVKLDFKTHAAFDASELSVRAYAADGAAGCELWVNADLLQGPMGAQAPFDAPRFVRQVGLMGHSVVLSAGWTTTAATADDARSPYTEAMVDTMAALVEAHKGPLTFPVRAQGFVASTNSLTRLVAARESRCLTLWASGIGMPAHEAEQMRNVVESLPAFRGRTFYDLQLCEQPIQKQ